MDFIAGLIADNLGGGTVVTVLIVTAIILSEVKPVRDWAINMIKNPKKSIQDSQIKERLEKSNIKDIDPRESIYKANRRFENDKRDK